MGRLEAALEKYNEILRRMVESGASDLHLKGGLPPVVRLNDELRVLSRKYQALTAEELEDFAQALLPKHLTEAYHRGQEVDLSYAVPALGRFRLNVYRYRGNVGLVARHIPLVVPSLSELGLPAAVQKFATQPRGLILVTGTTGSGKSTTVAACLNEWNQQRSGHIVTIEDPIEYVLSDKKSIITQREVGIDTESFTVGLKNALRQDPDVIMIGEMRDKETIQIALNAAETGHLVISTLHTKDAIETVNRMMGVFDPSAQREVRIQFASALTAIVSQRLLPKDLERHPPGLVAAVEILVNTSFIKSCLLDPAKIDQIRPAMEQGFEIYGMQTFDQHLMQLFKEGAISREVAIDGASSPSDFELRLRGIRSLDEGKWESLQKKQQTPENLAPPQLGKAGGGPGRSLQGAGSPGNSAGKPGAPKKEDTNTITIIDLPGATLELDNPFRKDKK